MPYGRGGTCYFTVFSSPGCRVGFPPLEQCLSSLRFFHQQQKNMVVDLNDFFKPLFQKSYYWLQPKSKHVDYVPFTQATSTNF